jgi:hypothetical protein
MKKKQAITTLIIAGLLALFCPQQADAAVTMPWNTFMGSSTISVDTGQGIAVDSSGNVYVMGVSNATWGSPINAYAGGQDAFVAKYDSSGTLLWNTFMGSTNNDYGYGIAVDSSGNVYVTGYSGATWGSPINAFAGTSEVFVAKLNSSGTRQWHTFMGSASYDYGTSIAVDSSGNVYVTGNSTATWGSPINAFAGGYDAFVAKLNSSGTLLWNTFMGSVGNDVGQGIAVDSSGNVYVTGYSSATWGSPIIAYAGSSEAFVAKLNTNGTRLWNTFMGSTSYDYGYGIAVDSTGNVYVTGFSTATWGSPINAFAGDRDVFVAKLNSSGTRLWNTFMGSVSEDDGYGIAVDSSGNVYVMGSSYATWGNPINAFAGGHDAFVAKLQECIDADNDGYGTGAGCLGPDCNDNDPAINPAATEVCNNIDDDCDGGTDEDLGSTTCGVGACQVTVQNCVNGTPQTCTPGLPADETCNNVDDDCDGGIDEGLTRSTGCGVGACSASGTETCSAGSWGGDTCIPGQPTDEVCNNIDDDCDGSIDEGLTRSTGCGVGACAATGIETCSAGTWGGNTCIPGTPGPETCNGLDDDCDGQIDEGIASTPTFCGVGACASTGTSSCQGGRMVDSCTPGQPGTEVCNWLDDDCDGVADNGLAFHLYYRDADNDIYGKADNVTVACAPPYGYVDNSTGFDCDDTNAAINPAAEEVCGDGIDNNCDGQTDEGCPAVDSDGDGIPNADDNCPDKPNGLKLGTCSASSDKAGATCHSDADCVTGCSSNGQCLTAQEDSDGDGVGDVCDNCLNVCNPQQLDANNNGIGDLCDPNPACGGCSSIECEQPCPPPTTTTTIAPAPYWHIDTCVQCHTVSALMSRHARSACSKCHDGAPQTGNVSPRSCVICHPRGGPGTCSLVNNHGGSCVLCHVDCSQAIATTGETVKK